MQQYSANESQITLTNPASPTEIVWDKDSMTNAILYVSHPNRAASAYRVKTGAKGTKTKVLDSEGKPVASVEVRSVLPDVVTLRHFSSGKSIKMSEWLKDSKAPASKDGGPQDDRMAHTRQGTVMQSPSGSYLWLSTQDQRLALYDPSLPETPIACFFPATSTSTSRPCIRIAPGTLIPEIEIVLAVLVLEQRLRMEEKRIWLAQGMAQVARYAMGRLQ